jgi:hypothetical protein
MGKNCLPTIVVAIVGKALRWLLLLLQTPHRHAARCCAF